MEDDKQKDWLDLTKRIAVESFWKEVFNQSNHSFYEKMGESMTNSVSKNKVIFPRCDMFEKEDQLIIVAELPGIKREDFSVILKGDTLILTGNYSTLKPKLQYYLKERENKSFEKTIKLPVQINKGEIRSNLENGLLKIILPIIKEEAAVPIYIDIPDADLSSSTKLY